MKATILPLQGDCDPLTTWTGSRGSPQHPVSIEEFLGTFSLLYGASIEEDDLLIIRIDDFRVPMPLISGGVPPVRPQARG